MKTNAIIRIVLFSIAIVFLCGILLAALAFGLYSYRTDAYVYNQILPNAGDGTTNNGAADADQIRNLDIEWVSGSITIQPDENASEITLSETYVEGTKNQMVYKQTGNTLKIQYCEDSITFPSFGINIDISKDLVITVPAEWSCGELNIDAASANIIVNELSIQEVDFDGASGTCDFNNCQVDKMDIDGASGDINFSGTLNILDFDGASASCYLEVTNVPSRISVDGMSGDLDLTLPEDCGFVVSIDAMSSNFQSDFPTTMSGGDYVYGDKRCRISFSGMSGDLNIRKG
ncbi:MAG: DUF4097 family beta strand repeat protein [Oscillospiraceae bacterium]|nr:DUF4097 family beta strand repeat protein [Oscillospiraceae bacterium]